MPPRPKNKPKKDKPVCPHCDDEFPPQGFPNHVTSCLTKKLARESNERYYNQLREEARNKAGTSYPHSSDVKQL